MADDDTLKLDPALLQRLQSTPVGPMLDPSLTQGQTAPVTLEDLSKYLPGAKPASQPQQQPTQPAGRSQPTEVPGKEPASIRYNNPGAMWDGASATKFGSTSHGVLSDGNHIAKFDDPVAGAAAQFDLLNSSKYINKPIGDLVDIWSGHTGGAKQVSAYASHVADAIGLSVHEPLTTEILQSPNGIAFAKAQARMEAGKDYPLTDEQWQQAQQMALGTRQPQGQLAQVNTQQQQPYGRLW